MCHLGKSPLAEGQKRGYFALPSDTEDGDDVSFFRVDRKKDGRILLSQQAGPAYYPVSGGRASAILTRIASDPEAAGLLYAAELGRCMRCGLELTDPISRELGIGPTCRSKIGA